MRRAIIHLNHRLIPPHHPLGAHKHRIVKQRILAATRKQRRRQLQAAHVREERADGGIAPLLHGRIGQQRRDVGRHDVVVDDEVLLVMCNVRQEARKIVASKVQEEAAKRKVGDGRQEVQGYEAGEVAAGRLGRSVE